MSPIHYHTRFNPTPTGDMHLGHVYLCLVNEYEAHSRGAKFYVRFDDTQFEWVKYLSNILEMQKFGCRMLEDMEWLGIGVDEVVWQSDIIDEAHSQIQRIYGIQVPAERMSYDELPTVKGLTGSPFPYAAPLAMEKAWMDWMIFCDHLIRGIDLVTEFSLYCYWVERFRLQRVRHVYLPRLLRSDGIDPSYGGHAISKTHGSLTVREFRDKGYNQGSVLEMLRRACLVDEDGPWSIDNVKERPMWEDD